MMKIRGAAAGIVMLMAAAPFAHAEPAVKNGKWEITYQSVETGAKPAPEAAPGKPPERAARAEPQAGEADGKPVSRTVTSCNRKAVTEKVMLRVMSEKGECARKVISRTGTGEEVEITCPAPHASKALFKYEAEDPETVTSSVDEEEAGGVKKHITASAHWVGACSSHS